MRKLYILIALALCLTSFSAKTITGKVIAIKDGDTIVVLKAKTTHTIRLDGIDCPEKKQAFGDRARQFASQQVFGKKVRVEYKSKDRLGLWVDKNPIPPWKFRRKH
jgi:endonuclease YncB( thermonuclease family)